MLHGFQSAGKYKTLKRYVLKSTSFLGLAVGAVGLDLSSPIHAVLVIISGWHKQPRFTLLPPMQQHRPPPLSLPTTILLGTGAVVLADLPTCTDFRGTYRFWPSITISRFHAVVYRFWKMQEFLGLTDFVLFCFRRYSRILPAFSTYRQSRRCIAAINSLPGAMSQC